MNLTRPYIRTLKAPRVFLISVRSSISQKGTDLWLSIRAALNYENNMVSDIFSLFEADKKKEVERVCSDITIKSEDLLYLVELSEANIIEFPYLHACKFLEETSDNVKLTEKNLSAIANNGVGELNRDAHKAIKKIFQMPLQVKRTTAHLFYRCDHRYWHLFYFDLKDRSVKNNHWDYDSHVHYVSWLWPNLECKEVWSSFCKAGKKAIGGHEHIRFKK